MAVNKERYQEIIKELSLTNTTLVAVSKTKPVEEIKEMYEQGQLDFGENYVQELVDKQSQLPGDIRWHFIGHLQSNKVKYIAPFISLIQGVDSLKLLREINKQGVKNDRIIDCLLQVHIAQEETKFGMDENELDDAINQSAQMANVRICGLMGMASFTDDMNKVRNEFRYLKTLFDKYAQPHGSPAKDQIAMATLNLKLRVLSMGMSSDYKIAIEEGSTMVRIGSLLFGERN
jgi:pyridoxal phosphate enzyme (YggS family)